MKIEKINREEVAFKDIEVGEAFAFAGHVYLKIDQSDTESAFDFSSNDIADFDYNDRCVKLKAKVVIE
jgi:hypothetical protein